MIINTHPFSEAEDAGGYDSYFTQHQRFTPTPENYRHCARIEKNAIGAHAFRTLTVAELSLTIACTISNYTPHKQRHHPKDAHTLWDSTANACTQTQYSNMPYMTL